MGGGHVPDVVEVEGQARPRGRCVELAPQPGHPVVAQPVEVDPLLPVDGVEPKTFQGHYGPFPSVDDVPRRASLA